MQLLTGFDRGDPVAPADGDEYWHADLLELFAQVIAGQLVGEGEVLGLVVERDFGDAFGGCRRIVVLVVQRGNLAESVAEVLVALHQTQEGLVQYLPGDLRKLVSAG